MGVLVDKVLVVSMSQRSNKVGFKDDNDDPIGANDTGLQNTQYIGLEAYNQPDPDQPLYPPLEGDKPRSDSAAASASGVPVDMEKDGDSTDKTTLSFRDGVTKIDYVLAYRDDDDDDEPKRIERRKEFVKNLIEKGLQFEYEDKEKSEDKKTYFIKVHAPFHVLGKYAEILKIKMPIKENDIIEESQGALKCLAKCPNPFELSTDFIEDEPNYFTAQFFVARQNDYIGIENKETFFNNATRSRIVYEIMERTRYDPIKASKIGIHQMVGNGEFAAAFPLHEGNYTSPHSMLTHGSENDRRLLYEEWARPRRWYKYQPLDLIRNYFGEKVAIYFAWLGFYTGMLIPASFIGLICFIYGCATAYGNIVYEETCDANGIGNATMCPQCDKRCDYWKLKDSCIYTSISLIFDNGATVFFAIFMALWATMFLEIWKRKQAEIDYDWDLFGFEDQEENCRPEFEIKAPDTRVNPITKKEESHLNWYNKYPRITYSLTTVLFMIGLVVAAVFAVIVYRIAVVASISAVGEDFISSQASLITTCTASCLNLVAILLLSKVYQFIAVWLTDLELPRTDTDWEDSFTFKMFLFQFVNYYSSLFYMAFFKGKFVGSPANYDQLFGYRLEECDPGGCLVELCLQLAIVMVGKQVYSNIMEIGFPMALNWWRGRDARKAEKQLGSEYAQWEKDFDLQAPARFGLFDEYLELVIQYGFVTLFVSAFSLAPLFALLNNIVEIRLDAYKYVTQVRRPMAARAQDIGAWYWILDGVGKVSVVTNAFIIAFTSEFVPRLVFTNDYSADGSLVGYVNNSLSYFNTSDFQEQSKPEDPAIDVEICRYKDYRQSPWDPDPYVYTTQYWHVLAAKLAFVILFEHIVFLVKWMLAYIIPDLPEEVKMEIKRENYLAQEALNKSVVLFADETGESKQKKAKPYNDPVVA